MKTEQKSEQNQSLDETKGAKKAWIDPEFVVLSVQHETRSGGAGPVDGGGAFDNYS